MDVFADAKGRIEKGGSPKYHDKNTQEGKLFARERIALLLDAEGQRVDRHLLADLLGRELVDRDAAGLRLAARSAAWTCRGLLRDLLGAGWRWPDRAPLGLGGEELGDDVLEGNVRDGDVRDRARAQDVL